MAQVSTVEIMQAHDADLPAILNLLACNNLPTEGLSSYINATLVAREDGVGIVGSAALELYGQYALLRSVAVDERQRGHGLGQRLTQAALDMARQQEVTQVYLLTETAGWFFPKFGFRFISRGEVPAVVLESVEFAVLCPSTTPVMILNLKERHESEN